MKRPSRVVLAVSFLLGEAVAASGATRPAAEQSKIDWLLTQIGGSGATFIRNGKDYDAKKAVSHLRSKLFWAGKRGQTARDFILGVASHSEETGKSYEIRFPDGRRMPVGEWLLERLNELEKDSLRRFEEAFRLVQDLSPRSPAGPRVVGCLPHPERASCAPR